jgi:hypothetical protein
MRRVLAYGAGLCVACLVQAAPDEIQVYTAELNRPGEFGLEQHVNYVLRGQQTPDYAGQMTSHHVLQLTPEFSYGLTETLEAGLYLPFAIVPGGDSYLNGLRLRLKYIAPRQDEDAIFYGLNVEVGRDSYRTSTSLSGMELRPIVGYRDADWLLSFNPILNLALAADASHRPQFEPALKLSRRTGGTMQAGLEYYGEYGAINDMLPADQRSHMLFLVADIVSDSVDINVGIGRGYVNAADDWVMKAIVALPLE